MNKVDDKKKVLKVFLSSPNELSQERKLFNSIIEDSNLYITRVSNMILTPVKWETHTYPSSGIEPQDVINSELPECDIYIGLMGSKIGTETSYSDSGTVEEFERFFGKYSKDKNKKILFYFKNIKKDIYEVDLKEVKKVQDFRSKIGNEGIYYWCFGNVNQLKTLMKLHLFYHAMDIRDSFGVGIGEYGEIKDKFRFLDIMKEYAEAGSKYVSLLTKNSKLMNLKNVELKHGIESKVKQLKNATRAKNNELMRLIINGYFEMYEKHLEYQEYFFDTYETFFNLMIDNFIRIIPGMKLTGDLPQILILSHKLVAMFSDLIKIIEELIEVSANMHTYNNSQKKISNHFIQAHKNFVEILNQSSYILNEFIHRGEEYINN